jgi:XTP/dITP diphosphohydrolase
VRADVIYLASQNAHKAIELGRLLGAGVAPLPGYEAPVEDGTTFLANARLKAQAGAAVVPAGGIVVADDSGIVVEALGGAPGIHSARYGGDGLDDPGRVQHLLRELGDAADRRAAFVCVLVAVLPDGSERIAEGRVDGTVATAPRGDNGFGYDPIFVPVGETRTIGELSDAEKDAVSHRSRAAAALRAEHER